MLLRDAAEAAKSMRRIRLYTRVGFQDFKDKFYRKKIRPSQLQEHAEEIYDENLTLKNKVHQLEQHVLMQKTQNKMLNNELEKQHDIVKRFFMQNIKSPAGMSGADFKQNEAVLIMNLKRELDSSLKTLAQKEQEINSLKKC